MEFTDQLFGRSLWLDVSSFIRLFDECDGAFNHREAKVLKSFLVQAAERKPHKVPASTVDYWSKMCQWLGSWQSLKH